jgi:hypothetical protein
VNPVDWAVLEGFYQAQGCAIACNSNINLYI